MQCRFPSETGVLGRIRGVILICILTFNYSWEMIGFVGPNPGRSPQGSSKSVVRPYVFGTVSSKTICF